MEACLHYSLTKKAEIYRRSKYVLNNIWATNIKALQ
jgi:hypothetical protein